MASRYFRFPARLLAALAVGLVCAGGCEKKVAPTPVADNVEVRLGYFANLTHAQAVLGVDSGELAQTLAPHKLKTLVFNAGPSLIEALFAGSIDVGYVGPGPVLNANAVSHGEGLRVISGAAANGVVIVARPGINSLADLVGKRIATPQHGNTQDISARHYVRAVLGQADDSNVINIANAQQGAMMAAGSCDAAWAPEPWGSLLVAQTGAKILAEEKDLWPDKEFSLTVIVTTPQFLRAHPDVIEGILKVHRHWTRRLQTPAGLPQLGSALEKLTGKKLPPGVMAQAFAHVRFTDEPLEGTFTTMGQWSYDLGLVQHPVKLEGLFELDTLRRLQRQEP